MTEQEMAVYSGEFTSPGGHVFGVQGWTWGEQRPTTITFYLNGTAEVKDQHGRPIKGVVKDSKPVYFAKCTHAQVIAALADERIDWLRLVRAGWPQLPYDQLLGIKESLAQYVAQFRTSDDVENEVRKIADPRLRKDARRMCREIQSEQAKEGQLVDEE